MTARLRPTIVRALVVALLLGVLVTLQTTVRTPLAAAEPTAVQPVSAAAPAAVPAAAALPAAGPVATAPVVGFDPGNILSDALMNDSRTMDAGSVQNFLNVKGASCRPAAGSTCIRSYSETTPSRAADSLCPAAYTGASNESAAQIIAKVGAACGINPQVLIVTLQKEQGLITSTTGKTPYTYSRALGFGCPDNVGGWCNPAYAGFANQVYSAAKQLKRYASNPGGYSYRSGRTNTVLWHPNAACGSSQVYIQNQATASLYNYTPYRPNQAALNAGYGSGDSCSSYGNRNFYLYFTQWFGSTQQREPVGSIDLVKALDGSTVKVAGWAFDPDVAASVDVHFYVDGVGALATTAKNVRTDVGTAFGRGPNHGYDVNLKVAPGTHSVCVYAIDGNGGSNVLLGCRSVTVKNQNPVGSFDLARAAGPGTLQVTGWAFDPDFAGSVDVHVYVDGRGVYSTKATNARTDVAALYKRGAAVGFDAKVQASAGTHDVCVYAIDSGGGTNVLLGCKKATVVNRQPVAALDVVQPAGPGKVQVRGWGFDPDTTAPIDMHVYVDGGFQSIIKASTSRPDVGTAYSRGPNHGYDSVISLPAGNHSVCLYAIDSSGGTNPYLGCRSVTVANTPATGALESATTTTAFSGAIRSSITVSGWAWDFDTTAALSVRVLVDGRAVATTTAGAKHAAVSGVPRATVGYTATVPTAPGTYSVCTEALDPQTKGYVRLGCQEKVVVANANPVGVIDLLRGDAATATAPARIVVGGWAQDYDTTEPIWVHVYVDGVQAPVDAGKILADAPRADVEQIHKNGAKHGFTYTIPASPGTHTVCAYSINVPQGQNHMIGTQCRTVTVP